MTYCPPDIAALLKHARKEIGSRALHRHIDRLDAEELGYEIDYELPDILSGAELMSDVGKVPPMLVDQLLPDRSLFLLTGKPKAGKSFLALDIADRIARGLHVFGELRVNRRGRALYLAMEDGRPEIARRLEMRRFMAAECDDLLFITEPLNLSDPDLFERFRDQAQRLNPSLIVIDTAAEALGIRDWINRSEIAAKIAPLRSLARELCTILLVAHNRKSEGEGGDEIAGSNALAGAVDGWISAHKTDSRPNGNRRLYLRVEGRGGVGHELVVEMSCRSLHFALVSEERQKEEEQAAIESSYASRRAERRNAAVAAFRERGGTATIPEVAASMNIGYSTAWNLIKDMAARGDVEALPESLLANGAGRPAPVYRLKTPET